MPGARGRTPLSRVAASLAPIALGLVVALLLVAGLVMSLDVGLLRPLLERRLSASLGVPVRVGSLRRLDHGFAPRLEIEDIRIAQPAWAGPGDMLRIRAMVVRLRFAPLLRGQMRPDSVAIDGLRLALVRLDPHHANWTLGGSGGGGGGSTGAITVRDGLITLDDRKHDHRLAARVSADDAGFRLAGTGQLAGSPSVLRLVGAPLARSGSWPFRLDYRSRIATLMLQGRADSPLGFGHFSARAEASGDDLQSLDRLIDVGLPATQPLRVVAQVRHSAPDWQIDALRGRIGRSDVALALQIRKRGDRTRVDGDWSSRGFDFDDLASSAGRARAAALRAAIGPRLFPNTRIELDGLRRIDGTLRVDLPRLIPLRPSPFRSLRTTLTLDHGLLTASNILVALPAGRVTGTAQVRDRSGTPLFTADLRVAGSRIEAVTDQHIVTGPLTGRIRLAGRGRTVRAAIGRSTGSVGFVVRNGAMARRAALFVGSDLGRALFEGSETTTPLHCLIARFDAVAGVARPAPLLVDNAVARISGAGTIALATEDVRLALTGYPKLARAVRMDAPVEVRGTLDRLVVTPPHLGRTIGNALKLVGSALAGPKVAPVGDADCTALAARALR